MAGKSKKKRNSKDSTSSNAGSGEGDDKKKKDGAAGVSKKKGGVGKSIGCDIFNDAAMENAYYVCHNVQVSPRKTWFALQLTSLHAGCS